MFSADLLIGVALLYLVAINGITWLAFATDKAAAQQGHSRVAESTLLLFALMAERLPPMAHGTACATRPANSRSACSCTPLPCFRSAL